MDRDPRDAAARYRAHGTDAEVPATRAPDRASTAADRAAVAETAIQQAIRAGAFDNLPGAGEPIRDLGTHHDPDWWIRRKIQAEDLRGLGPEALRLRVEDAGFAASMDEFHREADVRAAVEDFNARVRHARMQLMGGPPVVTSLRDAEAEVAAWHERRAATRAATGSPPAAPAPRRRRWRRS